ncbi:MAG: leucine-rich repeat protein [Bacteroidales bacterium]|nr:leucine-rich repeat protein [Bacteroidales bacterium]
MKRILLFLFAITLVAQAWALEQVKIGNLWYEITEGEPYTARLIGHPSYENLTNDQYVIVSPFNYNNHVYTVTEIGSTATSGCYENLTSITIPEGVTTIKQSAFSSCWELESVSLPQSLEVIEDDAFMYCSNLTSINIPNTIKFVGNQAFEGCPNDLFEVSGNLKYVGNSTNKYMVLIGRTEELATYEINENCKIIMNYAFAWNQDLQTITLPNSITTIEDHAFFDCSSLKSVNIPTSVATIYNFAFLSSPNVVVLCESASKPNTWKEEWYYGLEESQIIWDYKNIPITTAVNDENRGSVTGAGKYEYGKTATLTATPKSGYKFVAWSDGNHSQERQVTVAPNLPTFTAYFYSEDQDTYDVITSVKGHGSVSGDGIFLANDDVELIATPDNEKLYHFVKWSDGNEENPRSFKATANLTVTAIFEGQQVVVGDNTNIEAIGENKDNCTFHPTVTGRYTISITNTNVSSSPSGYIIDDEGNKLAVDFPFTCDLEKGKTYHISTYYSDAETEDKITLTIADPLISILATTTGNGKVSGSGVYAHNSSATLTATSNEGYHFVAWQDGNTTNPRTITVTESATYTATFAINEYEIAVAEVANGSTTGAGTYEHGETVKLTATPAEGYHFEGWGDDNTENPREFTATMELNLTPSFAKNTYTVSVEHENGSITGDGTYEHGATAHLVATANSGYEFASWSDDCETAERDIVVTANITLRAIFISEGQHLYNIKVAATENGTIAGDGKYIVGSTATLHAYAAEGYHFVGWGDGNTDTLRVFTVNADMNLTPTFAINTYTVSVEETENGSVSGAKTYNHGDNVKIVATANEGYHFAGWRNGEMAETLEFTATQDTVLVPSFAINTYRVTAKAENGSVSGVRTYTHGSEANLTAYAEYGYHFVKWADGETNEMRSFIVTRDTTFTALFEINKYKATVTESAHGTVSGAGEYTHGESATFTATADAGYQFLFWSDGGKVNPRVVKMTQDVDIRAVFSLEGKGAFTITVGSDGNGTVKGGGMYIEGETATIKAVPESEAYHFVAWSDGSKENPRQVVVSENSTLRATFEINTYTITATMHENESERGEVTGGGTYSHGAMATIRAVPAKDYRFVEWNDGVIDNVRYFNVTKDENFVAHFAPAVGTDTVYITIHDTVYIEVHDTIYIQIETNPTPVVEHTAANLKVYPNPTAAYITVNADRDFSYVLYDINGTPIRREENANNYVVDMSGYPKGVYLLKTSDGAVHKIMKK